VKVTAGNTSKKTHIIQKFQVSNMQTTQLLINLTSMLASLTFRML